MSGKAHYFGRKGKRRLRQDEIPAPRTPNSGSTVHLVQCSKCHESVASSRGGYWEVEADGWVPHRHQPEGDDVHRLDPIKRV